MMEGANLTMIYCKNFCKCYNVVGHWWLTHVILATQEAEIRRMAV
jgi:hypothetical protein